MPTTPERNQTFRTRPTAALALTGIDTLDASGTSGATSWRADGTLWSHAASPGTYVRGDEEFSVDFPEMHNMVAVFTAGQNGASKVPIDYEHETYDKRIAGTTAVPYSRRAGEVVELRVIATREDLEAEPEIAAHVAAEEARRARLGGVLSTRPLEWRGLWARWDPTRTALSLVQARELNDMSVTIAWDAKDNTTGASLGPTLLSIALTNTPFIDTMVPVAASRGAGGTPAAPGNKERQSMSATKQKRTGLSARIAAVVAALTASASALAAVADEGEGDANPVEAIRAKVEGGEGLTVEEAKTLLEAIDAKGNAEAEGNGDGVAASRQAGDVAALTTRATSAEAFVNVIASELGDERDPVKALAKVRELRAHSEAALTAAREEQATARTQAVAAFLSRHETKIAGVPQREYFASALTRELEAGNVLETAEGKTVAPTALLLTQLPVVPGMEQQAGGDTGGSPVSPDVDTRIDATAKALLATEPYKAIAASKGRQAALKEALFEAGRQIHGGAGGAQLVS